MVFKPFSHLARRSTKAFAHGYAQSLAAASQSSYASSTTPLGQFNHHRLGRSSSSFAQRESFHGGAVPQSSGFQAKSSLAAPAADGPDTHLDAYAAAWHKQQQADDWQGAPFAKKLGWRQARVSQKDAKDRDRDLLLAGPAAGADADAPPALERSKSLSAIDAPREAAAAAAAVRVEPTIVQPASSELSTAKEASSLSLTSNEAENQAAAAAAAAAADRSVLGLGISEQTIESTSSEVSKTPESGKTTTAASTAPTSASPIADSLENQIVLLEQSQHYAEIPALFEALLRSGASPSASAYNALITSAIHLTSSNSHAVSKVLDVHSDMLRRHVTPDIKTFTLLIELLATRALEVARANDGLAKRRLRFAGSDSKETLMLRSRETEEQILGEDVSLRTAIRLFDSSAAGARVGAYSTGTYRVLIEACAQHGAVDEMIRVYSHMESRDVLPAAAIYPPMIYAFAVSGDLRSAVECYNEYKKLAVADDAGSLSIAGRADDQVYAAVVRSYLFCGKEAGAQRFFDRVTESLQGASAAEFQQTNDSIIVDAFIPQYIKASSYAQALDLVNEHRLSPVARNEALQRICAAAADHDDAQVAIAAFQSLSDHSAGESALIPLLAMHTRSGDLNAARAVWHMLVSATNSGPAFVEATSMYASALIEGGSVGEGLAEARQSFDRIRAAAVPSGRLAVGDLIDESIESICSSLRFNGAVPSAQASVDFLWAMVENGGVIAPVAEQLLAGLGVGEIATLHAPDLRLVLQVEAGIVGKGNGVMDVAHASRLASLLEWTIETRLPLDQRTSDLVESSLKTVKMSHPDIVARWQAYRAAPPSPFPGSWRSQSAEAKGQDTFDPYAYTLDQRGSSSIVDELERSGANPSASLNEALTRFRNMRRAGRHPRYIAYAKLIGAAARDGRTGLVNELYELARQDVPLQAQYPVVRHGWTTILDAMVGASLTTGQRAAAGEFHQQLLDLGAAPTANTFGLYITTLKESTKTFDEATEAVKIFHRAVAEGVEPSSFLYNAVIGKLGKARRIDDCLYYFSEMRAQGIRPTSVTYGTIVNALCRVSDEKFAQDLFDEMESMPNYKPRPAPYNSMMQFFLTTKRDSSKVLEYYRRMQSRGIAPTMHTYKLLIDTYATLDPIDLPAAERVLGEIRATGREPEAVHYSSLIHAKGCVLNDMAGAKALFDTVAGGTKGKHAKIAPQACLYQALFEGMVANHCVRDTEPLLETMEAQKVQITPYIANTLIHGWSLEGDVARARAIFDSLGKDRREPSTYETMIRALIAAGDREAAQGVVQEMLSRGYPSAVSSKVLELMSYTFAGSAEPAAPAIVASP